MARKKTATQAQQLENIFAAGRKRGYDTIETNAFVERHMGMPLGNLKLPDLKRAFELISAPAGTTPKDDEMRKEISKDGKTSERVSGKPFRKDLVDRREVERKWTKDEISRMTDDLLGGMSKVRALEDEKAVYVTDQNKEIKEHQAIVDALHTNLVRGTELSEREVKIKRNFDDGVREIYDLKTNELITTEPLTAGDMQLDALELAEENERREEEAGRKAAKPKKRKAAKKTETAEVAA